MENEDHRSLGRRLRLFDTVPVIGAGLPIWLPDGAVIRGELERLAAEIAERTGCVRIHTPVLAKRALFEQSGHWDKFAADMFPVMKVGDDELVLRPANCPSHVQVYAAEARSWRDLPVRLVESASMFRSELSGVLGGLSRVRQINLDDAHVFCTADQVVDEVVQALDAIADAYEVLGVKVDHYRLSGRGADSAGTDHDWDASEADLRAALRLRGLAYIHVAGEGAFYGPKIDVQVRDAAGREETLSTVQVDRVLPQRFGLSYVGPDGAKHRPVMIHRGLLSSMERLVALLIEQHQGRFPTWLSPVQVALAPVDPRRHADAAEQAHARLAAAGIRARVLDRGSLGSRIARAHALPAPFVAVLGDREAASGDLTVNGRSVELDQFIAEIRAEIDSRAACNIGGDDHDTA
ncbi:threonine--tRNA ligase [Microbacterium bovistercoris]|uniref:Threonine--tRNA ligase n=1 Tax=Microbacterium bovistercoris TaxID=2293570 RepID=A0A371NR33_9MICO|nr:threonine--tRNA ligase [Microbacterium bovistercoris]REJ04601.1 threonine--tRNA ligase [Microbacterium bovistercoris]